MLNLKLKNCSYLSDPLLENIINICENLNENYYFAINNKNQIIKIKDNEINLVYELNNEIDTQLIAFGHLPDLELICLIYENGSICTVNLDRDEFNKIDLGFRLITVDFSPEYDKIVLTTDSKLILLNSYFEEISRSDLNDKKQGAVEVLNVGWGKKETQFHGSEGKQARTIKKELIKCSELDDLKPRITWRDDGVYFATSVVDPINLIRKIRVYDNEGILQQTSEEQSGLEYLLNWKPNSNLITSSINLNTGHFIVFFEKNGQRFDEFCLPYKKDEFIIQQLIWSYVADCLVIFGEEKATKNQIILIYTMKNYHWYCKQKLIFNESKDGRICKIINENQLTNEFQPLNLKILFNNGRIGEYVYLNQVHTSSDGDSIVIDGKQILFTPFQYSTVPPPMYGYSLQFNVEVNEVCFCQSNNRLLIKLADNSLHLIERTNTIELDLSIVKVNFQSISYKQPNRPLIYTKYLKINIDNNLDLGNYYQFNLTNDNRCYALSKFKNELLELNLNNNESKLINLNDKLIKLITLNSKQSLILVDSNGFVWNMKNDLNYKIEEFKIEDLKTNKFNQIRLRTPIDSLVKLAVLDNKCCLSLYSNYFLYINHLPIQGSDCNSFLIHNSNCLMYTTNDHKLRSIWLDDIYHLLDLANDLPDYDADNEFRFIKDNDDNKLLLKDNIKLKQPTSLKLIDNKPQNNLQPIDRTVERGSRLVASSSNDCKVIIQMPRGNLEIITPRLLLLDRIKLLLNTIQYWSAFELIKKHRVNLNLIVDFDLNCFLINCKDFIEQMSENDNLNDLNLFLSELSNENVLDTLYSNYNRILRDKVNCNTSISLFQLKFPELFSNFSSVSANLGDQDCIDGKSIHLNNYLLTSSEDQNSINKSMNLNNYLVKNKSTKLTNVCLKLRESMIQLDEKKYFIPILLTYIKESKESIGTALLKIHQQECKTLKADSLNYLKYIIDINILIKEALGVHMI